MVHAMSADTWKKTEYEVCDGGQQEYIHVRLSIIQSLRGRELVETPEMYAAARRSRDSGHHLPYERTCLEWWRSHDQFGRNLSAFIWGEEMV